MTEHKDDPEATEEHVEDLEAPASQQDQVAGGREPVCGELTDCGSVTEG
jgi:hypothetical protein